MRFNYIMRTDDFEDFNPVSEIFLNTGIPDLQEYRL